MTLLGLSKLLADNRQIEQPHLEALNLLEIVSRLPQSKLLAGDFQLTGEQTSQLGRLIRLRRHLPLAYLRGEKEFHGLAFHVNACTLIPRPESEDLVSLALERRRHFKNVYDVGAGRWLSGHQLCSPQPKPVGTIPFHRPQRRRTGCCTKKLSAARNYSSSFYSPKYISSGRSRL